MNHKPLIIVACIIVVLAVVSLAGPMTSHPSGREVTVYTSVDQVYSEPVLKQFENETGITVKTVYDVEAAKTTGLVNRLIAEKNTPTADLFWSSEFAQTLLLKEKGVIRPYVPANGSDILDSYKDPQGYWTGTGGRARIFLVNTALISPDSYPESIFDILNGTVAADRIGIAHPLFGTSGTFAAALYTQSGPEKGREFYQGIRDKGVRVVDGNSVVKDMVARGELVYGITDTDDACMALSENPRLLIIGPDQKEGEMGTLVIPNTVALINGSSHPREAEILEEYLVSRRIESKLIDIGGAQIPLRSGSEAAPCLNGTKLRGMNLTVSEIYQNFDRSNRDLSGIFIQ